MNKSLASLGSGGEFAVVLWKMDSQPGLPFVYPDAGLAKADKAKTEECRDKLTDITARDRTTIDAAIRDAVKRGPTEIVIATPKDDLQFDEAAAGVVTAAIGSAHIKVDTIYLSDNDSDNAALKSLAAKTGGTYRRVSPSSEFK